MRLTPSSSLRRIAGAMCLLALVAARPAAAQEASGETIAWNEWSPALGDVAAALDRLILVRVAPSWSTWDQRMQKESWAAPEIVDWVMHRSVPVRVDADRRPDLAARLGNGAYPRIVVLLPTGHPLAARGYLPRRSLQRFLNEAERVWNTDSAGLLAKARAAGWGAPTETTLPAEQPSADAMLAMFRAVADIVNGGGSAENDPRRWIDNAQLDWAALTAVARPTVAAEIALWQAATRRSLMSAAIRDPLHGGIFRYSTAADWSAPRFERLLEVQARWLQAVQREPCDVADLAPVATFVATWLTRASGTPDVNFVLGSSGSAGDGEAGARFTWTAAEWKALIGDNPRGRRLARAFGLDLARAEAAGADPTMRWPLSRRDTMDDHIAREQTLAPNLKRETILAETSDTLNELRAAVAKRPQVAVIERTTTAAACEWIRTIIESPQRDAFTKQTVNDAVY
jgi:uncharacterized protein YyaL (SSP411 family)